MVPVPEARRGLFGPLQWALARAAPAAAARRAAGDHVHHGLGRHDRDVQSRKDLQCGWSPHARAAKGIERQPPARSAHVGSGDASGLPCLVFARRGSGVRRADNISGRALRWPDVQAGPVGRGHHSSETLRTRRGITGRRRRSGGHLQAGSGFLPGPAPGAGSVHRLSHAQAVPGSAADRVAGADREPDRLDPRGGCQRHDLRGRGSLRPRQRGALPAYNPVRAQKPRGHLELLPRSPRNPGRKRAGLPGRPPPGQGSGLPDRLRHRTGHVDTPGSAVRRRQRSGREGVVGTEVALPDCADIGVRPEHPV